MDSSLPPRLAAALAPRYVLGRALGRGGMATVYAAEDRKHRRAVAIKVLRPELSATLVAERFLQEIQIAAGLNHPHILPLFDSGHVDGTLYYVMPLVEGESLRDRLRRERQLPLDEALTIARQVGSALVHAHARDVVHRDIKPENILFSGGEAVVADFGIARAVTAAGERELTKTGLALGTPAYMSPEQAGGERRVDARTDIYSLGCVLYEMLAGEPPFTGASARMVMARHMADRPPSLTAARPELPGAVEKVVHTALAKSPADRYQSAERMTRALDQAVGGRSRAGRRTWVALGTALLALAVVLVLLVPRRLFNSELQADLYLVGSAFAGELEGDSEAAGLWEHHFRNALRQVPDLDLPPDIMVSDHRRRADGAPESLSAWRDVARDLRAGRLVMLTAHRLRDSTEIVAAQYDVSRPARSDLPEARVRVATGSTEAIPEIAARLAEELFSLRAGSISPVRSTNEAALRAFVAGYHALGAWDLDAAEARLQEALTFDRTYRRAHFWLAQMRAWAGGAPVTWLDHARRATESVGESGFVDPREHGLAMALRHLGEGRYARACEHYSALVAADSADFDAWFGLGECHAKDPLVAPDPTSPSGWAYR
ncbi:MAG: protein kinase domain-containing protein, partial [Gemmatimonadota bacterium]